MFIVEHRPVRVERSRRLLAITIVALLHLALMLWMAMTRGVIEPQLSLPVMDLQLFSPGGGGSPAADAPAEVAAGSPATPSARVPDVVQPWDQPPPAQLEPVSPDLLVGQGAVDLAPVAAATTPVATTTGGATGGAGTGVGGGTGSGVGSGVGSGRDGGTGLILIRGPRGATITQNVTVEAMAAQGGLHAVLRCRVRPDQWLDNCRVLRAYPQDSGVGRAALGAAREYRFRAPTRLQRGRRVSEQGGIGTTWVTLGFSFPEGLPQD